MKNKLLSFLCLIMAFCLITGFTKDSPQEVYAGHKNSEAVSIENSKEEALDYIEKIEYPQTFMVNDISVNIEAYTDKSQITQLLIWVDNIPDFLKRNINSINAVWDIYSYSKLEKKDGYSLLGFQREDNIFLDISKLTETTLYHEVGHTLDYYSKKYMGSYYSESDVWVDIFNTEWTDEDYFSTSTQEAFAQAVNEYYLGSLDNKPKTKAAIERIINTDLIKEVGEFKKIDLSLNVKNNDIWFYSNLSDLHNEDCRINNITGIIKAVEVNEDGTWYKVKYNENIYYLPGGYVKFN